MRKYILYLIFLSSFFAIVLSATYNRLNYRAPECDGATFCLHADGYPEELISQAIQSNSSLKMYEFKEPLSKKVTFFRNSQLSLDAISLCKSYERIVKPRSSMTINGDWQYVLNQRNFIQEIRVEVCMKELDECVGIRDAFAVGYKTFCKQKYVYRQLLAVDFNGTINTNWFPIPSNCCCQAIFTGNPEWNTFRTIKVPDT